MMKAVFGVALFSLVVLFQPARAFDSEGMRRFLQQQETQLQAKIGMSVVDASGQPVFGYRQHTRFPLTSTFKVLACAALLDRLQQHASSLDQSLRLQPDLLLAYSPVTKDYHPPARITLRKLCSAAVSYSDNTAGNRILDYLGGPSAVTRFMRNIGDAVTRLDRTEPTLNEATPGDPRDTTTPENMANNLHTLLDTRLLTPPYRQILALWMREDKVADGLLRAALPSGWKIADKTGAGGYGSRAIIAAVYPVSLPPFYVAIYITQTAAAMNISNKVIAETGQRLFADSH